MTIRGLPQQRLDISVESETPQSFCCECGASFDCASGPTKPSPGDFTLCIRCASLNVFADDLTTRKPRRVILAVGRERKAAGHA